MRFRWQEKEFELVAKPTFAEIDFVERKVGQPMDEWSNTTSGRVGLFWAVRRADPQLLSWERLGDYGPSDFEAIDDDVEDADADPPASAPSSSPDGLPGADGSSATGDAPTSST